MSKRLDKVIDSFGAVLPFSRLALGGALPAVRAVGGGPAAGLGLRHALQRPQRLPGGRRQGDAAADAGRRPAAAAAAGAGPRLAGRVGARNRATSIS